MLETVGPVRKRWPPQIGDVYRDNRHGRQRELQSGPARLLFQGAHVDLVIHWLPRAGKVELLASTGDALFVLFRRAMLRHEADLLT